MRNRIYCRFVKCSTQTQRNPEGGKRKDTKRKERTSEGIRVNQKETKEREKERARDGARKRQRDPHQQRKSAISERGSACLPAYTNRPASPPPPTLRGLSAWPPSLHLLISSPVLLRRRHDTQRRVPVVSTGALPLCRRGLGGGGGRGHHAQSSQLFVVLPSRRSEYFEC